MKNLVQSILQVIGICIFWILFFLTIFNNLDAVRELRYCAESNFYNECKNNCKKRDFPTCNRYTDEVLRAFCINENIGVCNLSCSASARDWRNAYIDFAFDNIIKQITGGLAITTANILDGTIGSIAFVIKFIKNGQSSGYFNGCSRVSGRYSNNLSDITIFSDFVLKTGLYYEWHYAGCYRDLLSKHIAKSDRSFCFFHFEDFIRVATNIFVCIVFICLTIRIFSFNFRDSIFEISGECIYFGWWRA